MLDKLQTLPMLRDVATDQQVGGTTATLTIDRDQAARFGIQPQVIDDTLYDAFGQRQITQYFTQVNTYHLILEVMPGPGGRRRDAEQAVREVEHRPGGAAVDLREVVHRAGAALSISHQSQFPAVTISFNLAQGAALGEAVDAINAAMRQMGVPITRAGHLPGHRAGVPVLAVHASPT